LGDETCPHWIVDHIKAFGFRTLAGPKPMMKAVRLPTERSIVNGVREL
jgi:hypothetical protein